MRWKIFRLLCRKFITNTDYQVSSYSAKFCRKYDKILVCFSLWRDVWHFRKKMQLTKKTNYTSSREDNKWDEWSDERWWVSVMTRLNGNQVMQIYRLVTWDKEVCFLYSVYSLYYVHTVQISVELSVVLLYWSVYVCVCVYVCMCVSVCLCVCV